MFGIKDKILEDMEVVKKYIYCNNLFFREVINLKLTCFSSLFEILVIYSFLMGFECVEGDFLLHFYYIVYILPCKHQFTQDQINKSFQNILN